jgi:hypothetical protein
MFCPNHFLFRRFGKIQRGNYWYSLLVYKTDNSGRFEIKCIIYVDTIGMFTFIQTNFIFFKGHVEYRM